MPSDKPEPDVTPAPRDTQQTADERADALRAMAQGMNTQSDGLQTAHRSSSRNRLATGFPRRAIRAVWFSVASAVVAVVVAIVLIAHVLAPQRSAGMVSSQIIAIAPRSNGINAPVAAAWSPDGKQIAIVGYLGSPSIDPDAYQYAAGALAIYSAQNAHLVTFIRLDDIVAKQVALKPPSIATPASGSASPTRPVIEYTHILWFKSENELALTFRIVYFTSATSARFVDGALFMKPDGSQAHVFTYSHTDSPAIEVNAWTSAGVHSRYQLPTAYSYEWSADNVLVAQPPLPTDNSVPSSQAVSPGIPVGNPNGDQTFTAWQPGTVQLDTTGGALIPGVFDWQTSFAAWAPDGQALVQNAYASGRFALSAAGGAMATAQRLSATDHAPLLEIRDAGMRQALTALNKGELSGAVSQGYLTWSPNGKWLASLTVPNSPTSDSSDYAVSLYNCATGERVATLLPHMALNLTMDGSATLLSWSPDDKHIMLLDAYLGTVTIWQVPAAVAV